MNVIKASRSFEKWLGHHTHLVASDLRLKRKLMAQAPFPFFRATFYRWVQLWPQICPDLAKAPQVLAIGDLHVENFGTWRDLEGRLIWGVNDFDEAYTLAYTIDLVRLAASALLAGEGGRLKFKPKEGCEAILEGYRNSLSEGGLPFVLAENHKWMRVIAESELRDPIRFWAKMEKLPAFKGCIPASAREGLEHLLPERGIRYRIVHRTAGLGSLGHMRFVALAEWHGGCVAREAKALVPSSVYWARGIEGPSEILCQPIISHAVRCLDPFVQVRGKWIVRRLGPYCSRIGLDTLNAAGLELRLLEAMGWETANIHLGSRDEVGRVRTHLKKLKPGWLYSAAKEMLQAVTKDFRTWSDAFSQR
jgi:uncharacterized protein (DUF2252 family)